MQRVKLETRLSNYQWFLDVQVQKALNIQVNR